MSVRYGRSTGDSQSAEPTEEDERSYPTGADDVATPADDETAPTRPTFTPSEPTGATVPGPAFAQDDVAETDYATETDYTAESDDVIEPDSVTGPDDATVPDGTVPAPAFTADEGTTAAPYVAPEDSPATAADVAPAADLAPVDDSGQARPLPETTATDLDQPLLSDTAELRARWQQVQAEFVDDPQEAVGDAASLIDQTTQTMIDALQVRQRQLRAMWENGGSANGGVAANGAVTANGSDTEHLRQMMRHYRTLFNQLCQ
jgi:hypothetical protein